MSAKTFCTIAAVIFTLVALLHLTRIWMGLAGRDRSLVGAHVA